MHARVSLFWITQRKSQPINVPQFSSALLHMGLSYHMCALRVHLISVPIQSHTSCFFPARARAGLSVSAVDALMIPAGIRSRDTDLARQNLPHTEGCVAANSSRTQTSVRSPIGNGETRRAFNASANAGTIKQDLRRQHDHRAAHRSAQDWSAAATEIHFAPLSSEHHQNLDSDAAIAGKSLDHFRLASQHFCLGVTKGFSNDVKGPGSVNDQQSKATPHSRGGSSYVSLQEGEDDSDDEGEEWRKRVIQAGIFLPTDPWKETWDVMILMLILYSAVAVPYRICFNAPAEGLVWYCEQFVTVAFILDVGFNFNTAFTDNDETWVLDRTEITRRYLSTWFWIDFPSCVPVELLDYLLEGSQSTMGLLRFLRMFRLIRLLRLLKVRLR